MATSFASGTSHYRHSRRGGGVESALAALGVQGPPYVWRSAADFASRPSLLGTTDAVIDVLSRRPASGSDVLLQLDEVHPFDDTWGVLLNRELWTFEPTIAQP